MWMYITEAPNVKTREPSSPRSPGGECKHGAEHLDGRETASIKEKPYLFYSPVLSRSGGLGEALDQHPSAIVIRSYPK